MHFGETVYHCIDCGIEFCASCQSSHARTAHAISIVRITSYSWPPQPDVAQAVASCSQCSLEVKCRIECSDCLQCICVACYGIPQRRQPWYRHRDQHQRIKGFVYLRPPSHNAVSPANRECECLTVTGCISHCDRCLKGMLPSRRFRILKMFLALLLVGSGDVPFLPANSRLLVYRIFCLEAVTVTVSSTRTEVDASTKLSTTCTSLIVVQSLHSRMYV